MAKKNLTTINSAKDLRENCAQAQFTRKILSTNALAFIPRDPSETDVANAVHDARVGLKALNPNGGMQEMLTAQMLSIHELQQNAVAFAVRSNDTESVKYYTNAAIKLANCFTQQANILSRLQGQIDNKITVGRVDVHHGGQAIVGDVIKK